MKASTHTPIGDGLVENPLVVEQIRAILGLDYCVYGYHVMTSELREMGYLINPPGRFTGSWMRIICCAERE